MQFTLDSLEQFKACLLESNKGKKVFVNPVIFNDLKRLYTENQQNGTYYFGILTIGNNVITCYLKDADENNIIQVEKNTQIIDYFNSILCHDSSHLPVYAPLGHFRGFEINLR